MSLPQKQDYTLDDIYALPDGQRAELIDGEMYMMAQGGMLSAQRVILESLNGVPIQQLAQIIIVPNLNLLDLMRGSEAIEEMLEWNP